MDVTLRRAALVVVALVAMLAIWIASVDGPANVMKACGGVGLDGPSAKSPSDALARFVESQGGSAKDWKQEGNRGFLPSNSDAKPAFSSLTVSEGNFGEWKVSEACV